MNGNIIFTDLDGTLLTSSKEISMRNRKAIGNFRSMGGSFSIATGRVLESMEHFLDDIDVDLPIILYNGAVVYDTKAKKVVHVDYLNQDTTKKVISEYEKFSEELDIALIAFNIDGIYLHKENKYTKNRFQKDSITNFKVSPLEEFKDDKFVKLMFVGERENLLKFKGKLGKVNSFTSDIDILEVLPEDVSKWTGIKEAIKPLDKEPEHIYTFGDNQNDLDMIINANTGVAMKNACSTVLERSKNITEYSNDDDGVGRYIENII